MAQQIEVRTLDEDLLERSGTDGTETWPALRMTCATS